MKKLLVIDIVGLSKKQLEKIKPPNILKIIQGGYSPFKTSFPAVTCSVQASIFSGKPPSEHGIISNGYYDFINKQVLFWEQSDLLVESKRIWDILKKSDSNFTTSLHFLQNSLFTNSDYILTPKPIHLENKMINWCYSIPPNFYEKIVQQNGEFDLSSYWGPFSSIRSSEWIINSVIYTIKNHNPNLLIVYLPHLDYAAQKFGPDSLEFSQSVHELDLLLGNLLDFLEKNFLNQYQFLLFSEYAFNSVNNSISPNIILRDNDLLEVRTINGKEYLDFQLSKAFAMVDHQIAHIYVKPENEHLVKKAFENYSKIKILSDTEKINLQLNHKKSGNLILESSNDSWFNYYWWYDVQKAPEFTFTVDIHRKPGYDPLELFVDPQTRTISQNLSLIKGSHGLVSNEPENQSIIGTSFNYDFSEKITFQDIFKMIHNYF